MYDTVTPLADSFVWLFNVGIAGAWFFMCIGAIDRKDASKTARALTLVVLTMLAVIANSVVRHIAYIPERLRVEAMMPELLEQARQQRKLLEDRR